MVVACPKCGIVLKDCSLTEIKEAINYASKGKRFICQQVTEMLLSPAANEEERKEELPQLTKTEQEI